MRWGGKDCTALSPLRYVPTSSFFPLCLFPPLPFHPRHERWSFFIPFSRVIHVRVLSCSRHTHGSLSLGDARVPPTFPPLSLSLPYPYNSVSLLRCVSYISPDATFGTPPRRRHRRCCRRCCCVPSSSAVSSLLSPSSSSPVSSAFTYLLRSVSPWATFFCRAVIHRDNVPLSEEGGPRMWCWGSLNDTYPCPCGTLHPASPAILGYPPLPINSSL